MKEERVIIDYAKLNEELSTFLLNPKIKTKLEGIISGIKQIDTNNYQLELICEKKQESLAGIAKLVKGELNSIDQMPFSLYHKEYDDAIRILQQSQEKIYEYNIDIEKMKSNLGVLTQQCVESTNNNLLIKEIETLRMEVLRMKGEVQKIYKMKQEKEKEASIMLKNIKLLEDEFTNYSTNETIHDFSDLYIQKSSLDDSILLMTKEFSELNDQIAQKYEILSRIKTQNEADSKARMDILIDQNNHRVSLNQKRTFLSFIDDENELLERNISKAEIDFGNCCRNLESLKLKLNKESIEIQNNERIILELNQFKELLKNEKTAHHQYSSCVKSMRNSVTKEIQMKKIHLNSLISKANIQNRINDMSSFSKTPESESLDESHQIRILIFDMKKREYMLNKVISRAKNENKHINNKILQLFDQQNEFIKLNRKYERVYCDLQNQQKYVLIKIKQEIDKRDRYHLLFNASDEKSLDYDREINTIYKTVQTSSSVINRLEKQKNGVHNEKKACNDQLELMEKNNADENRKILEKQEKIMGLKRKLIEKTKMIEMIQKQIQTLKTTLNEPRTELSHSKNGIFHRTSLIEDLNKFADILNSEISHFRHEYELKTFEIRSLKDEHTSLILKQIQLENMKKKCSTIKMVYNELSKEFYSTKMKKNILFNELGYRINVHRYEFISISNSEFVKMAKYKSYLNSRLIEADEEVKNLSIELEEKKKRFIRFYNLASSLFNMNSLKEGIFNCQNYLENQQQLYNDMKQGLFTNNKCLESQIESVSTLKSKVTNKKSLLTDIRKMVKINKIMITPHSPRTLINTIFPTSPRKVLVQSKSDSNLVVEPIGIQIRSPRRFLVQKR